MKVFNSSFRTQLRVMLHYRDLVRNHFWPVTQHYIRRFRRSQQEAAHTLQCKKRLEVAFFLSIPGMWKLDEVYKAMLHNDRYHPYVVIYPFAIYRDFNSEELMSAVERTRLFIEQKGYDYIIPYDKKCNKWIDVKLVRKPDVVFFSSPYKESYPKYYIYNYRDTLTCYVSYGFITLELSSLNYDLAFHNLVGLYFLETDIHRNMSKRTSRNKGVNTVVTGYPATEVFLRKDYVPQNLWKPQSRAMKKVIFAPHHSIDQVQFPSVFLEVCDVMLELAEKYHDSIQFVFKPHQVLKFKLQQSWGLAKTEAYFQKWDSLENTQLISDGYVDLFLTSDAMIHDCGSFTTEYLFVRKPVMYLCSETDMTGKFNEFGIHSFNCHYHGKTREDIERFLRDVVLEGKDPMKQERDRFFEEYLKPKDGILPSQKILKVLEEFIDG